MVPPVARMVTLGSVVFIWVKFKPCELVKTYVLFGLVARG